MLILLTRRFMTRLVLGLAALMGTLLLATPVEAGWPVRNLSRMRPTTFGRDWA